MKYYIIDWAGNFICSAPHTPLTFTSSDDAFEAIDDLCDGPEDYEEYY